MPPRTEAAIMDSLLNVGEFDLIDLEEGQIYNNDPTSLYPGEGGGNINLFNETEATESTITGATMGGVAGAALEYPSASGVVGQVPSNVEVDPYSGAIVPGLAKAAGESKESGRWGVDNPMFNTREDAHAFLQGLGMVPGGAWADIIDAGLYMTEGEWVNMAISLGAAVPILGMTVRSGNTALKQSSAIRKLRATVKGEELSTGIGAMNRKHGITIDKDGMFNLPDGTRISKEVRDKLIMDADFRGAWAQDYSKIVKSGKSAFSTDKAGIAEDMLLGKFKGSTGEAFSIGEKTSDMLKKMPTGPWRPGGPLNQLPPVNQLPPYSGGPPRVPGRITEQLPGAPIDANTGNVLPGFKLPDPGALDAFKTKTIGWNPLQVPRDDQEGYSQNLNNILTNYGIIDNTNPAEVALSKGEWHTDEYGNQLIPPSLQPPDNLIRNYDAFMEDEHGNIALPPEYDQ